MALTETNGIRYGLLAPEDVGEMAKQLAEVFSNHDPLAVAIGLPHSEIEGLVRLFGSRALTEGLTIIARARSGQLVGTTLAEDFVNPQPSGVEDTAPRFAPIGAILDHLDDRYRQTHPIVPGSHLHLFMVGVLPSFAGLGIAQMMIRLALENGGKLGYRVAVTEATGRVSQKIFRKLGFHDLFTAQYRQFLYKGDPVFASIEGHEGTILMERDI